MLRSTVALVILLLCLAGTAAKPTALIHQPLEGQVISGRTFAINVEVRYQQFSTAYVEDERLSVCVSGCGVGRWMILYA